MKVTYNWLKDFVEIKLSPEALADKLTMAGLEVTSLERRGDDFVLEIEITPNRPDWLSVAGVARELAAITGKKLKLASRLAVSGSRLTAAHRTPPACPVGRHTAHRNIVIRIEDKKDCPLYTAKIIKDVKVGPSPDWLRKRLELIGCRPINNVADITNYILFAWGEPLHAFDLDKVVVSLSRPSTSSLDLARDDPERATCGERSRTKRVEGPLRAAFGRYLVVSPKIIVRRAKKSEEIITLDGAKRILGENILVIASATNETTKQRVNGSTSRPIAIAGIMGGKDSEVTAETKNVLLEAAVFNPAVIRRGRQFLGMQSESSYRFERGVDVETALDCSWRATELIQQLTGGRLVWAGSCSRTTVEKKRLVFDLAKAKKVLGLDIPAAKIQGILSSLGFNLKKAARNRIAVGIPAFRQDVRLEVDLMEEVARIFGYEKIPAYVPAVKPQIAEERERNLVGQVKNILVGLGLDEVVTYGLINRDLLKFAGSKDGCRPVEILNPLSAQQEILRPSLIPSLLRTISYNLNQKQEYIGIFEVAKVFSDEAAGPKEELVLGLALCGIKSLLLKSGVVKDESGPLHLKGLLEALFLRLNIKGYDFVYNEGTKAWVIEINTESVGSISVPAKSILEELDIKNKMVFAAQVYLGRIFTHIDYKKKIKPLEQYPAISRDSSFVLKENVKIRGLLQAVKEKGGHLLQEVKVADYYKGKQIPPGFKGLTITCVYRSGVRTLTEAEVNSAHSQVLGLLSEGFAAELR